MYRVVTDSGTLVNKGPDKGGALTRRQAESDAADRNARAEALGIRTRYRAVEVDA